MGLFILLFYFPNIFVDDRKRIRLVKGRVFSVPDQVQLYWDAVLRGGISGRGNADCGARDFSGIDENKND